MNKIPLKAEERNLLGKKVKQLRRDGIIPAHVYGNKVETEHVSVNAKDLMPVIHQAGETGVIELQIGAERVRPVMVRGIQHGPIKGDILHVDFYQVNLKEKVTVPVPLVLKELAEEIESVKMGEAVVLQTLSEVSVEALPTDLIDNIEVDISSLKNVDDAITVSQLSYNHETITVLAEPEEVVVKLAPAVTEEMQKLMEEQAAEAAEGAEGEEKAEGEEGESSEGEEGGEVTESTEPKTETTEEKS
jgi:large subunit ribosomal protein L25